MTTLLKSVMALLCVVMCVLLVTRGDRWAANAQPFGLVAAYGFEEGTGTSVSDASGNNNGGTLAAGTTWNTAGRFGTALQFNGTTSGVTVADANTLDLTTGMTVEAWVYPTIAPAGWRAVVGKDVDRYYLMASSNTNRPIIGATFSPGGNLNTYAPSALAVNTWTHLAATYDGTTVRLFVDGVQVATRAQSGALTTSTSPLTIGHNFYGERFTGRIDEVRVYNRALSVAEIQSDMNSAVGGAPAPDTTPPSTVTGLTATAASATQINLSWAAATDNVGVTGYRVERCQGAGCSNFVQIATPVTTSYSDPGRTAATSYSYRVKAVDGAGNVSVSYSNVASATTPAAPDTTPPGAPGTLSATATGTQIALSWGAATDNVGVTGYRVERCQGAGCGTFTQVATPTGLTYTDIGLTPSTSYSYRVRATDAATLLGPYSNIASATTGSAPASPPGLVAGYAFEEGTGTSVSDASGNNNGGTLAAGTTWNTAGRFGTALQFNGTTSGVTVADANTLDLTTGMTVEAWVYPTIAPAGWRAVVGKDVDRYYLMASSNTNRPIIGATFSPGGNLNTYAPSALAVNTWTHLAATYDGTTVRLFVDGVQVATRAQSGALTTSTSPLTIGHNFYGERFTGRIDEVRVYNRALSAAEIQADMGTPVGGTPGPQLTITQPVEGASVSGTLVAVSYIAAGDLTEVDHVHFQLDSLPEVMDLTFDGSYQLTNVTAGSHVLRGYLVRSNHSKIPGTDATPVNFSTTIPDTTPPAVSMTAPADGSTVSGVVTLAANASDNVGVAGVQFKIDGSDAGPEDLTFPYSIALNTATFTNGAHILSAVTRDVAGNTATSSPISVTFSNTNPNDPAVIGEWSPPFNWPIVGLHAALLPTGKILTWADASNTKVQLWNPSTGTFTSKPYTAVNLFCAGQTFLADGRLLTVGGHQGVYVGVTNATIFDSWTEQWVAAGHMNYGRWYPTATTLADGRVLTVSGAIICPNCDIPGDPHEGLADIAEIFDPATNSWTELSNAPLRLPMYPHMFLLPDGRLLASSANEDPMASWVLDFGSQSWSLVPGGVLDGGSAAMYAPGKIIKSGTAWNPDYPIKASDASTYVLDMTGAAPAWRQTAPMAFARTEHNLTLLPDGKLLATGGSRDSNVFDLTQAVYEAELWSPVTETWTTMASMAVPRLYHSVAMLLPDARVITIGGGTFGVDQLTAQIYSPPYLFKGPRPVITSAPATITYASTFTVQTPDAARISAVSLMGLGSVTHAFDASQRYLPLSFEQAAGAVQVTIPDNQNLVPPGYYMLFLRDNNGVPSVAAMVKVTADATPPSTPGTLTATATGTQVALSWGAATDNVGVTGYRVERCAGAGCSTFAQVATPTDLSYTDTGLTPSTSYSYRVRASDAVGLLGLYSNVASATTGSAPASPPGLVAGYAFEEGTGTTVSDASGNNNGGTLAAGTTWNPAGRFGTALQFNGTTSGVTVADANTLDLTTGMTVEAWVYPTIAPAGWRAVVGKDVDRYYLMASSNTNRPIIGATFSPGGNLNTYAPSALAVNTWTHLAATYDGTTVRLFVDGVQVATRAQSGALTTSTSPLTIGHNFYGERFTGRIDEVRVYNRALSAAEIQADMGTPVQP